MIRVPVVFTVWLAAGPAMAQEPPPVQPAAQPPAEPAPTPPPLPSPRRHRQPRGTHRRRPPSIRGNPPPYPPYSWYPPPSPPPTPRLARRRLLPLRRWRRSPRPRKPRGLSLAGQLVAPARERAGRDAGQVRQHPARGAPRLRLRLAREPGRLSRSRQLEGERPARERAPAVRPRDLREATGSRSFHFVPDPVRHGLPGPQRSRGASGGGAGLGGSAGARTSSSTWRRWPGSRVTRCSSPSTSRSSSGSGLAIEKGGGPNHKNSRTLRPSRIEVSSHAC